VLLAEGDDLLHDLALDVGDRDGALDVLVINVCIKKCRCGVRSNADEDKRQGAGWDRNGGGKGAPRQVCLRESARGNPGIATGSARRSAPRAPNATRAGRAAPSSMLAIVPLIRACAMGSLWSDLSAVQWMDTILSASAASAI